MDSSDKAIFGTAQPDSTNSGASAAPNSVTGGGYSGLTAGGTVNSDLTESHMMTDQNAASSPFDGSSPSPATSPVAPAGMPSAAPAPSRPDFKSSAPAGDIVLVPDKAPRSKLPLIIGIIASAIVILAVAVIIITTAISNSHKRQLETVATTLVADEDNLSLVDSIFIAASKNELRLENTMTEDFYNGFKQSIDEYNKLCEQVCDLNVGNSSPEAEAARSAIEKIKDRNAYYSDTFTIYANFYQAFVKDDEAAKNALSEHSNGEVKKLYQELATAIKSVEDVQKQGIESGCNDVPLSSATGTCRELMDKYSENRKNLTQSPIMNKIFTASEQYKESLIPEKESEMHSLIDKVRNLGQ